jgi:hypothetical protein
VAAGSGKVSLWSRYGGVIGAGADIALNDRWSARIEYLFIDYASRDVVSQLPRSILIHLTLQTIRLGLDYSSERRLSITISSPKTSQHPNSIGSHFMGKQRS